jgi:hypothetical protein
MSSEPYQKNPNAGYATGSAIDAGLQEYMQSVYRTMSMGLAVTGLTAFGVASTPALLHLIFGTPLVWIVMFAPLAFIWFGFTPARVARMPAEKLYGTFVLFSAVMGLSMAAIFQVFTGESIARVFFITAATFAGTSLYGYTAKRDLTAMGSFMFMGLMGIFIAMIVNIFMHSAMVQFVVSVIGVVVFTGLTAWETQRLKSLYAAGATEANAKTAIVGALSLYLNFINLFQMLLQLMGNSDRR